MMQSFNEKTTLIGSPVSDNGKLKAYISFYFSISANSDVPDGAWEVMKYLLSDEMQKECYLNMESGFNGIPVNRSALLWNIDQVVTEKSDNGEKPVSPELEESFVALLESIDSRERYDNEIGKIVLEEAPPYFLGQKTAEEVAVIMESRINLILNERKDS
jgi:multiple sugar transport system substrate-binding protein